MVAEYRQEPAQLALLYEPDLPPLRGDRLAAGWKWGSRKHRGLLELEIVRDTTYDEQGARIQHAVARYVLNDVSRAEVAADLQVSARQVQSYLRGEAWATYTQPLRRAFERLGIGMTRGEWHRSGRRPAEIVGASQGVMYRALCLLTGYGVSPAEREQLLADLRLLTITSDGAS